LQEEKWYDGRRKPKLQIKILENIALSGDLSKAKARDLLKQHHYPEISQAFDSLEKKGMIKFSRGEPGRGRKERFYKITEEGIISLLGENPQPHLFWQAVIKYCQLSTKVVTLDEVEFFYDFFIHKYLKYSADHIFYRSQIDHFNRACDRWLQGINEDCKGEKISVAQKVVEALALKPKMALDELVAEVKEPKEQVEKFLSMHSFRPIEYVLKDMILVPTYHTGENDRTSPIGEYYEFMLHSIIIATKNGKSGGTSVYELSLFGVVLALALVRYNDAERLNSSLHYNKIPLPDYFGIVAKNYRDKLPLIFGKWDLLKMILDERSAYNFDIVIDRETRLNPDMAPSILAGGNREFFETAKAIVLHNRRQLGQVQIAGLKAYLDHKFVTAFSQQQQQQKYDDNNKYKNKIENGGADRTIPIYLKLLDITLMLDLTAFYDILAETKKYTGYGSEAIIQKLSAASQISILEEAFAEEITLLYYLALNKNHALLKFLLPSKYMSSIMYQTLENAGTKSKKRQQHLSESTYNPHPTIMEPIGLTSETALQAILRKDEQIRQWFSTWIEDSVSYNKEIVGRMVQLYDKIKG
jgi:hypothetical protein